MSLTSYPAPQTIHNSPKRIHSPQFYKLFSIHLLQHEILGYLHLRDLYALWSLNEEFRALLRDVYTQGDWIWLLNELGLRKKTVHVMHGFFCKYERRAYTASEHSSPRSYEYLKPLKADRGFLETYTVHDAISALRAAASLCLKCLTAKQIVSNATSRRVSETEQLLEGIGVETTLNGDGHLLVNGVPPNSFRCTWALLQGVKYPHNGNGHTEDFLALIYSHHTMLSFSEMFLDDNNGHNFPEHKTFYRGLLFLTSQAAVLKFEHCGTVTDWNPCTWSTFWEPARVPYTPKDEIRLVKESVGSQLSNFLYLSTISFWKVHNVNVEHMSGETSDTSSNASY